MYFMDDSLFSAPRTGPSVLAVEAAAAFSTSLLPTFRGSDLPFRCRDREAGSDLLVNGAGLGVGDHDRITPPGSHGSSAVPTTTWEPK
jgi:NADPH:quinone reductase-like Zn-dependent oxidoreductase